MEIWQIIENYLYIPFESIKLYVFSQLRLMTGNHSIITLPIFMILILFSPQTLFQLQLYGYNSQLYRNFSDAITRSQGLVAISMLVQVIIHSILLAKWVDGMCWEIGVHLAKGVTPKMGNFGNCSSQRGRIIWHLVFDDRQILRARCWFKSYSEYALVYKIANGIISLRNVLVRACVNKKGKQRESGTKKKKNSRNKTRKRIPQPRKSQREWWIEV